MDLAFIAMYLVAVYGTAAIAYAVGRNAGARDERARRARTTASAQRLEVYALRRELATRAHDAQYERMRNVERSAR